MKYYQLSQTLLHSLNTHFNIDELNEVIGKLKPSELKTYVTMYQDRPNGAHWGCGVYELQDNGDLKLIHSDWDSSD